MKRLITLIAVALACSSADAQATSPGDPLPPKLAALAQLESDIAAAPAAAQGGAAFYAKIARNIIGAQQVSGEPYLPYFVTEDRVFSTNAKLRATTDPVHNCIIWSRYSLNQALGQPASLAGYYRDVQILPWP